MLKIRAVVHNLLKIVHNLHKGGNKGGNISVIISNWSKMRHFLVYTGAKCTTERHMSVQIMNNRGNRGGNVYGVPLFVGLLSSSVCYTV